MFDIWDKNRVILTNVSSDFEGAKQVIIKHAMVCRGTTFYLTKAGYKRLPRHCYGIVYFPRLSSDKIGSLGV